MKMIIFKGNKNNKSIVLVVFVCLNFYSGSTFSQNNKYVFGYFLGANIVPNSYHNILALGKEIGITAIKTTNQKFNFQFNVGFVRKKFKLVPARYKSEYARGHSYLKPKYNVFEIASLLNYKWYEKKNGAIVKIIGGISINVNHLTKYGYGANRIRGTLGSLNEVIEDGEGGRNVSANIVLGISSIKLRKKKGRPITWTLLYQKAVSKSPTFHIVGNATLNSDPTIHYNYTISPFLDLLSVRLTFYPFEKRKADSDFIQY